MITSNRKSIHEYEYSVGYEYEHECSYQLCERATIATSTCQPVHYS